MTTIQYHADIQDEGKLSKIKLADLMQEFQEELTEKVKELRKEGYTGDILADAVFNAVAVKPLLSTTKNGNEIEIMISAFREEGGNGASFGAEYAIEERNEKEGLKDVEDYPAGEEEKLIAYIQTM